MHTGRARTRAREGGALSVCPSPWQALPLRHPPAITTLCPPQPPNKNTMATEHLCYGCTTLTTVCGSCFLVYTRSRQLRVRLLSMYAAA